jgi:hypothetical protein
VRERVEVQGRGHQRLARPGGGVQDDVLALEERQHGLFLGRVQLQALAGHVIEEEAQQLVGADLGRRDEVVEGPAHGFIPNART